MKFLEIIKRSLRGEERDYTSENLNTAITILAIPMVLEMLMESLFSVVDVFFVSKIGINAVAAVGITEAVITIVYSIAFGLGAGATAMVARRVGEKKIDKASEVVTQSVVIGLGVSLIVSIIGFFYADLLLERMGGSEALIKEGTVYTRIILVGNATVMMIFILNGVFRGAGNASIAMKALALSNFCNIVLDPLFIFGFGPIPALGLKGAAIATTTGRGIGVAYQLYVLLKGTRVFKFNLETLKIKGKVIWRLFKISFGGMAQFLIDSASWIFLMRILAQFGDEVLAAYTIAIRMLLFTILPSFGLANAAATLVGQNLGANQAEKAEKTAWKTALYNAVYMVAVSLIYIIFAPSLMRLFSNNSIVIEHGIESLKIIALGFVFFAYGMVLQNSFNGAGDTKTPTFINIFCLWLILIPVAYLSAVKWEGGSVAVYWSLTGAHSLLAIVTIIIFRRGKWKLTQV